MNTETIRKIGEQMVAEINIRNIYHNPNCMSANKIENELNGMTLLLKAAEIPFEFIFADDAQDYLQIAALKIADQTFACAYLKD